jgi:hypothetical protein
MVCGTARRVTVLSAALAASQVSSLCTVHRLDTTAEHDY